MIENIKQIIDSIGDDSTREGVRDTPKRVIKSWQTIYGGYKQSVKDILQTQFTCSEYSQMITLKNIEFYSTCEHHMQPFVGNIHIAYIPVEKVVGLSKLARVAEVFARRLQIQEKLTEQIAQSIWDELSPLGVGVCIEAKHFCMMSRGVNKQNSVMRTTSLKGNFKLPEVRAEFLESIK